jgi:hypothetical protein
MILPVGLVLAMVAMCDAQSTADKDKKKANKNDKDPASTKQVYNQLMAFFDQHDIARDGYWSKEEIISAYGLPRVNEALNRYDDDKDGRISRAEYEDWAKENAPDIAREREEEQREYEEAVKKYQEALAKAAKDARERIQRQMQEARERFERNRRDDRRRDLDRRDRRRRR